MGCGTRMAVCAHVVLPQKVDLGKPSRPSRAFNRSGSPVSLHSVLGGLAVHCERHDGAANASWRVSPKAVTARHFVRRGSRGWKLVARAITGAHRLPSMLGLPRAGRPGASRWLEAARLHAPEHLERRSPEVTRHERHVVVRHRVLLAGRGPPVRAAPSSLLGRTATDGCSRASFLVTTSLPVVEQSVREAGTCAPRAPPP
jgi:hypothetical protein